MTGRKKKKDEEKSGNISCTLRLPPELNKWLEDRAQKVGIDKSRQTREALEDYRQKIDGPKKRKMIDE